MRSILVKSFGGLGLRSYIRHLLFGAAIAGYMMLATQGRFLQHAGFLPWAIITTLLYPYARYAYESAVAYIVGTNQFWTSTWIFLLVKFFTMTLCWAFAVFIAPVGLLFLAFRRDV